MPYLVFEQATRLAAEARAERERSRLQEQAHLGWQITSTIAAANAGKGYRPPTFERYLKRLGLGPKAKVTKAQLQAEKRAGAVAADRVREAFKRHGVRKAE